MFYVLLLLPLLIAQAVGPVQTSRPLDIAFRVQMIDPGFSESVAVADFNRDGRLDILSAEVPGTKRPPGRSTKFGTFRSTAATSTTSATFRSTWMAMVTPMSCRSQYFARRIVWLKNPGKGRGPWVESEIDAVGPTEFAFLVDLNNDGKAQEVLPQFTGGAKSPLTWYEVVNGKWVKHVVSSQSYGHGIGAGDVNGDKRNDILTPQGWLEAPPDVRAPGDWTMHATDWSQLPAGPTAGPAVAPGVAPAPQPPARPAEYAFMYVIDVNKDGRSDVVTSMAHSYGVLWFEQTADSQWVRRMIDSTWANAHSSAMADLNGDGQLDLVAAKRYFGRTGNDPAEREPMGIYWYQFRPGPKDSVEWIRHIVDYGGRAGGGLQMIVEDMDNDGDRDVVAAGKTGVFLSENLTKAPRTGRVPHE